MSSGCGGAAQSPIKRQMSSSETRPSKYTFLMVASKKKGDRQKLYIKKRKRRTPRRGGGEDEDRYSGEWKMDRSVEGEE